MRWKLSQNIFFVAGLFNKCAFVSIIKSQIHGNRCTATLPYAFSLRIVSLRCLGILIHWPSWILKEGGGWGWNLSLPGNHICGSGRCKQKIITGLAIYQASLSLCKRLIAAFTHWIRVWFLIKEKDKVRVCRHRVWEGISELLDQFMYFWSKHVNDEIRNR